MLRGAHFVAVFRGVYRYAADPADLSFLVDAARLVLPTDAAVSHVTALRLFGFDAGPLLPLHLSTNHGNYTERRGIRVHRRQGEMNPATRSGHRVLGPLRTFVDVATQLDDRALLRVGDWLVAQRLVRLDELRAYVHDSHLDGVARARRVAAQVRPGVASPRESDLRWEVVRAGLPEPEVNADIRDDHGQWLARGDLVFRHWKVVVEYDGWQHERDARQRQWDHLRREQLEAAGWRVIVITAEDMKRPWTAVTRVRQALRQRNCPC